MPGDLRYLQFAVERKTGRIQLGLVFNAESQADPRVKKWQKALKKLWDASNNLWHSIWLNFNTRRDNIIFGPKWYPLYGEPLLWETIAGVEVCFLPSTFAQANLELFEKMVLIIRDWMPRQATVTEFYAGVGVLGLCVADISRFVRCCELNPTARYCFEQATNKLIAETRQKLSFHDGAAGKQTALMQGADVVIVDPPRKGLDVGLLMALQTATTLNQIVYVSCGWSAFQRDCDALLEFGWQLDKVQAFLFFPGSNHIELAANFRRNLDS